MPDVDRGLHDRVRSLIDQSGMTHASFAEAIGTDGPKLSKSLAGVRRFTTVEISLIAEVCDVSVDWLLTGETPSAQRLAARGTDREAIGLARHRASAYAEVFDLLRDVGMSMPTPISLAGRPSLAGSLVRQGDLVARWARSRIADQNLFDVAPACESVFGVNVAIDDFGVGFDGLAWSNERFHLVIVNNANNWTRQRFATAHELGHVLCSDSQDLSIDLDVMDRDLARRGTEMRANSFAASFLMPEEVIQAALPGRPVDEAAFGRLVGQLGVSASSLAWRLLNLRLISPDERSRLGAMHLRKAARLGGWVDEYETRRDTERDVRAPGILATAAREAYEAGLIGVRPLGAVLGKPEEMLLRMPVVGDTVESTADEPVFCP